MIASKGSAILTLRGKGLTIRKMHYFEAFSDGVQVEDSLLKRTHSGPCIIDHNKILMLGR